MTATPSPIRVLIADDHAVLRTGLRMFLQGEPGFDVVGEAPDGEAAVALAERLLPDVLLLDLAMPRAGGLDALRALADKKLPVRVVLLTAAFSRSDLITALELGAQGVFLKESACPLLVTCLRRVTAGEYWIGHDSVADVVQTLRQMKASDPPDPQRRDGAALTSRELGVLRGVADGLPNKAIADRMGVSEQTVKNHLRNIFDKCGVDSRLELAILALERGLVPKTE